MSVKRQLKQYPIIQNGSMTGTSTITSSVTHIGYLDNIGVELVWSGAPVGTFQIQVSADYNQDEYGNVTNPGNWTPITLNPSPSTSQGSPIYVDMSQLSAPWLQITYTNSSGSGTLNAWITGKALS